MCIYIVRDWLGIVVCCVYISERLAGWFVVCILVREWLGIVVCCVYISERMARDSGVLCVY